MYRLGQSIQKELALVLRDKVGLLLMFGMPILLVLVITTLQNSAFKIVNDNKIRLVIFNDDNGEIGKELESALGEVGMFTVLSNAEISDEQDRAKHMEAEDALVGLYINPEFSENLEKNASDVSGKALSQLGVASNGSEKEIEKLHSITLYFSPVLQESYRQGVQGAVQSSLQLIQSRKMLNHIYLAINDTNMPAALEQDILENRIPLESQIITSDGSGKIPNATQHNVPAWTIFAMFFMVVSLGSSLIREKRNGSFIRLKTMPGALIHHILAKELVYLFAALAQVLLIFSLGVWLFPNIGLPVLELPNSLFSLLFVSVACGLCAVSYALCLGVFANTQEQGNGFGAVSIVIFAALGGIFVPTFAMPEVFKIITSISPLYWCLEGYYELFLNNGTFGEVFIKLIPILIFIVVLQTLAFSGLKRKNLI